MTFSTLFDFAFFVLLETAGTQRDPVIQLHMRTDAACLADHHAGAMIDKKGASNLGARMDVNPCSAMRPFCHDSWNERQLVAVEDMSQALDRDGFDAGLQKFPDRLELSNQVKNDLVSTATGALGLLQT